MSERGAAATEGTAGPASFRGVGPTTGAVLGLGADLARLLDHVTRRRGSLSLSQYQLLVALRSAHPDPREPWELGRALGSGSAQITALLDQLERAGLLERRTQERDRRRREVHLTDAGRRRVEEVAEEVGAVEARLLQAALTPDEAEDLGRLADGLREVLRRLTAPDSSFALVADPGREPRERASGVA